MTVEKWASIFGYSYQTLIAFGISDWSKIKFRHLIADEYTNHEIS